MCDYLKSNCDTDCMTIWSEVLKCTKEDFWGFFYKDSPMNDVIYMHAMSFVMPLELRDPKCCHLVQQSIGFPLNCYNYNFNCILLFCTHEMAIGVKCPI